MRHTAGFAYGEITGDAQVRQAYARAGLFRPEVDYDARDLTPEEEVENLAKAPLIHQPGTTWEYGLAVDVLGRVVEKASGMRLEDFLAERLLKPLGMKDTGFYVPKEQIGRLAQPRDRSGERQSQQGARRVDAAQKRFRRGRRRFDSHGLYAIFANAAERRRA
jgi:CubicO group peptidase (beta-lactamase class C family)